MLSGVPNFALAIGYTNASWTLKCDLVSEYVCRLLNELDRTGYDGRARRCRRRPDRASRCSNLQSGYVRRGLDRLPRQGAGRALAAEPELPRDCDVLLFRHGSGSPTRSSPLMQDFVFAGGTAVVTGAASGIGAAVAAELARRGSRLVLLDRDADRLAEVAARTGAESHLVDLADADAVVAVGERISSAHPRVRLLVNNAGIALGGRFDQVTLAEYEEIIDVNFRAVVRLTHTLLPALRAEPGSHLVNVSRLFGLIAPAGQTAYAASKFAVRGFSEALRQELAGEVGVTTVHPGGIRTRIAESARIGSGVDMTEYDRERAVWSALLSIPPERAAGLILDAVEHRKARVLIGVSAKAPDLLARLLPVTSGRIYAAGQKGIRALALRQAARQAR